MTDQTEKPKLGTRPPLGLKRTVETGKVKQSFSHGRSNTVVVEVKKRRILGRPGEAPPAEAPKPEPVAEAPKPGAEAGRPGAAAAQAVGPGRHHRAARSFRRSCCARPRKRACLARGSAPPRGPRPRSSRARKSAAAPKKSQGRRRRPPKKRAWPTKRPPSRRSAEADRAAEPQAAPPAEEEERRACRRRPGHAPAPKRPEPARPSRGRGDDRAIAAS